MNKLKRTCVILHLFVYYLCVPTVAPLAQVANDSIIVIFNNVPKYPIKIEAAKHIFVSGSYPIISIENNFHSSSYQPDSTKWADTLKIKPSASYIMLKHSFNTVSFMYFFFKKGDTVSFSYLNNIPVARVINRGTKKYDINFDLFWRTRVNYPNYTPYEIFLTPFFTNNKMEQEDIVNTRFKVKDRNYYLAEEAFSNERKFLDSVKRNGEISEDYYQFFYDKSKYLSQTISAEQFGIDSDSVKNILPPKNSSQLPYSFYNNFITTVLNKILVKKVNVIVQSNGQIIDYRQIFNFIEKDSGIGPPYKDRLLYNSLIDIANNFSLHDFNSYFKRFQKITKDSFLIADLKSKYPADLSKQKNSLSLITNKKTNFNFTDIITKNRGKIIYVDLWASWCIPCRAAMPVSLKLRNKYRAKNIVFIYLSVYDEFNAWLKANKEEGLEHYPYSYYILNSQTNKFLKEINLTSIPRYLLYNEKGILINQNAPGPTNIESEKLINMLPVMTQ